MVALLSRIDKLRGGEKNGERSERGVKEGRGKWKGKMGEKGWRGEEKGDLTHSGFANLRALKWCSCLDSLIAAWQVTS